MHDKFPEITHIDQVREAIKDRPEFIEADKGDYVVFNYMVSHEDSFDCPIRRECRGLIFDKKGKVLSRRFHKFFNLGEKPNHVIDWNMPHVVLEKLDGSMITPVIVHGAVLWGTKMGITDVGAQCRNYVIRSGNGYNYERFALQAATFNHTPIFEYTAPTNRIVIPYEEERLVLLAVRDNRTGEYKPFSFMEEASIIFKIPLVKTYSGDISQIKDKVGIEGVVVRFEDGHMVKCKTDWYCAIHKAKENILQEKNVVKLILEEKLDDILPNLPDFDRDRLLKYKEKLIWNVEFHAFMIEQNLAHFEKTLTRKEYALQYAQNGVALYRSIIFSCWGNSKSIREEVVKFILKNCSSQTKLDEIRYTLPEKW